MKALVVTLMLVASIFSVNLHAQGTIYIDNSGNTDTSGTATGNGLFFQQPDYLGPPGTLYNGPWVNLQIRGGPNPGGLVPIATLIGTNAAINSGTPGAFFDPSGQTLQVPGVASQHIAYLQIFAWEGSFSSYEEAEEYGAAGSTPVFPNPTGGPGLPPAPPATLTGMPALLMGDPQYIAPVINVQPQSRTNPAGTTATFTAEVSLLGETNVFAYQWENSVTGTIIDGGRISGATTSTLVISDVSDQDTGGYYVNATYGELQVYTSTATLTVISPPTLALQINAGQPQLTLAGLPHHNFTVQYSSTLGDANWVDLFSVTNLSSSPYQFTDAAGFGQATRFYRAVMR